MKGSPLGSDAKQKFHLLNFATSFATKLAHFYTGRHIKAETLQIERLLLGERCKTEISSTKLCYTSFAIKLTHFYSGWWVNAGCSANWKGLLGQRCKTIISPTNFCYCICNSAGSLLHRPIRKHGKLCIFESLFLGQRCKTEISHIFRCYKFCN